MGAIAVPPLGVGGLPEGPRPVLLGIAALAATRWPPEDPELGAVRSELSAVRIEAEGLPEMDQSLAVPDPYQRHPLGHLRQCYAGAD